MDVARDRLLGALAVAAAASIWGTLGFFAKILYAQGVSFESLVAVRASVGWLAVFLFLLATQGARSLRVARRDLAFLLPLGLVGIGFFYLLYFYTVRESLRSGESGDEPEDPALRAYLRALRDLR